MPELPEVETVVRALDPLVRGLKIRRVRVYDRQRIRARFSVLQGAEIVKVQRLGKQIILHCRNSGTEFYLAVHLRMSGRLLWCDEGSKLDSKHLRIEFILNDGSLRFYDTRRFGTVELSDEIKSFLPKGLDPIIDEFDKTKLASMISKSKQPLKNWLLRQDCIVGLGNIYACEILYAAKLNPFIAAGELSVQQTARLCRQTKRILESAIKHCGTTFSDFQDAKGHVGSYQKYLRVYGREDQSCKRCKSVIEREVQAGRSTFYCPGCQIS